MAIIQGDVIGGSAGFYPKEIEQSLRFNDDDSAYLSWTPASAGNRKTWTFSTWVKRGNLGSSQLIFHSGTSTSNEEGIYFTPTDELDFYTRTGGTGIDGRRYTIQKFRDTSAWYHIVLTVDTTSATANDRIKMFVNGEQITSFSTLTNPPQNYDTNSSNTTEHRIGDTPIYAYNLDGYLAETHFTDGTAYDATAFGEFKNGVWVAKAFTGSYGTNGFYLPFRNDYTVEGFSAVTYRGTSVPNYIGGVGFEPDLVWIKNRGTTNPHNICDSVRGAGYVLASDMTNAEVDNTAYFTGFTSDGFTLDLGGGNTNKVNNNYVAWCWDAGTGSPVSNTDGSITSTVKANPDRGFSIVSYTFDSSKTNDVGHGLGVKPDMIIMKDRDTAYNWDVYHSDVGYTQRLKLNSTDAAGSGFWAQEPDTSKFYVSSTNATNGDSMIAYCFHSVSGYSKMGSYTGGSYDTITTGFKPAFVMIKRTDSAGSWLMFDTTRDPSSPVNGHLFADQSYAEAIDLPLTVNSTGFAFTSTGGDHNGSGATYIYMAFADTREAAFWLDDSGNNNDWENNGLTESDISLDSPTNNFATLNVLIKNNGEVYKEGNLVETSSSSSTTFSKPISTISVSSGKWYVEMDGQGDIGVSLASTYVPYTTTEVGSDEYAYAFYTGNKVNNSTFTTYGDSFTYGDIVGCAFDADAGTIEFYKNGVSQGVAFTTIPSGEYYFFTSHRGSRTVKWNFGQDSSFAGNKVPQGYTDANGRGDFYYAPPAGYLALCTANLPEPAIGPNSASTSDEHFNTVLYTGTGSEQSITGVGFQPDFTWHKRRDAVTAHAVANSVSGIKNVMASNLTDAEYTESASNGLLSYDSDGFTVGNVGGFTAYNASGSSIVAWNWKANGSGVSNTDGSITSTVSANVDAGFSIVSYTGNGTAGATVGHGLSQAPDMMIVKDRDAAQGWGVYHQGISSDPETDRLVLNSANAAVDQLQFWQDTAPTSSVFTIGTDDVVNGNGNAMIAYCFHSVEGFSKFGSYTGNGSTDGPFVYTGFRPAFVLIKYTSGTQDWTLFDNKRNEYNVTDIYLHPSSSQADASYDTIEIDMLSNGFKPRGPYNHINTSGGSYIYMAFAEMPAKYSLSR